MSTFNDKPATPRSKTTTPPPGSDKDRRKRLADALRDNLRRRKAGAPPQAGAPAANTPQNDDST
ncbi:MAG: hypothetical protein ACTSU0_11750 [Alphaproteobacteria bacterium]